MVDCGIELLVDQGEVSQPSMISGRGGFGTWGSGAIPITVMLCTMVPELRGQVVARLRFVGCTFWAVVCNGSKVESGKGVTRTRIRENMGEHSVSTRIRERCEHCVINCNTPISS